LDGLLRQCYLIPICFFFDFLIHQELTIDVAATKLGWDLDTVTKALLLVGVANYEAGVACWQQKLIYRTVRPQEYIALTRILDDIPDSYRGPNCSPGTVKGWHWRDYAVPALNTPAFPEYPCNCFV
jgi:hypothetical protein